MAKKITSDNCPFIPLGDYVLLQRQKAEKTAGGIILPGDSPKNRMLVKGLVIAVGPGRPNENGTIRMVPVKPGDVVFFTVQSLLELGEDIKTHLSTAGFETDLTSEIGLISCSNIVLKIKQ